MSTQSPKAEGKPAPAGTSTLDLALQAVEYLVQQSRPASLAQIADALSCSVDYLLGRTDDPVLHQLDSSSSSAI